MKLVNIFEAKAQLSELVDAAAGGERVVICRRNQPVAELRPIAPAKTTPRPLGLGGGSATLPAAFFEPLPDDVLKGFEAPAVAAPDAHHGTRVAERQKTFGRRAAAGRPRRGR